MPIITTPETKEYLIYKEKTAKENMRATELEQKKIKEHSDAVKAYKNRMKNKKRSPSPVSSVSVESVKPPTKRKINALIRKIPDDTYNEKVIHKIVDKIRSGEYTSISDFPKPSKTGPKSKIVLK
jgi:hypothetical protein